MTRRLRHKPFEVTLLRACNKERERGDIEWRALVDDVWHSGEDWQLVRISEEG